MRTRSRCHVINSSPLPDDEVLINPTGTPDCRKKICQVSGKPTKPAAERRPHLAWLQSLIKADWLIRVSYELACRNADYRDFEYTTLWL